HHYGGGDPREGGGDDDAQRHLELGGTEGVGGLAQGGGDGAEGVLGEGADQGHDQDPHHDPGREHVEEPHHVDPEDRTQDRGHERDGEEAVDDGGDPHQDLEHRLEDRPHPAAGVLGEVDGRGESDRDRHQHGDEADEDRGQHQRPDPEAPSLGQPDRVGDELPQVDPLVLEEEQRLLAQFVDDPDRDGDREGAANEEKPADGEFSGSGPTGQRDRFGRGFDGHEGGWRGGPLPAHPIVASLPAGGGLDVVGRFLQRLGGGGEVP